MNDEKNIIEMHETWLTVNSIIGCTNGCKYCFLQSTNNNIARPCIKVPASTAIDALFSSKYYDELIPVCLLPNTDAFLNKTNMDYTAELLEILSSKRVKNPIIIITKCLIPDYFIELLSKYQDNGLSIVIYLSYSGLPQKYEPRINHEDIRKNFKNLNEHNIKIVHYFRPFLPANSKPEQITEMLDFVNQYTNVSVISGLKLKRDFIDKIEFWDITKKVKDACLNASGIWPKSAYNYFFEDYKHQQNCYQINACALASTLKIPKPEYYKTDECINKNNCSKEQREICASCQKYTEKDLFSKLNLLLKKINKYNNHIEIILKNNYIILKNTELTTGDCAYLTFKLGYKVTIDKKALDDNYFSSNFTNSEILIIEE